jgi:hypothetical protein
MPMIVCDYFGRKKGKEETMLFVQSPCKKHLICENCVAICADQIQERKRHEVSNARASDYGSAFTS